MLIRYLKIGEEKYWYDLVDEEPGELFTQGIHYQPESRIVCEEDNKLVGGLELVIEEPDLLILYDPLTRVNKSVEILDAMIAKGLNVAQSLNCRRVLGLIQNNDQREIVDRSFAKAGLRFAMEKVLYKIMPDFGVNYQARSALTFKSLKELGEEEFIDFLAKVYEPDVFDSSPEECFFSLKKRANASTHFYPEDWLIGYFDGYAAGVIMPQLHDEKGSTGSNFYLGVLPAVRGKGIGTSLQAKSVEILKNRGARLILGSSDIRNSGMIKIFESLGYEFDTYQYFYVHEK